MKIALGFFRFQETEIYEKNLREREFIARIHVPWNGNASKDHLLSVSDGPLVSLPAEISAAL